MVGVDEQTDSRPDCVADSFGDPRILGNAETDLQFYCIETFAGISRRLFGEVHIRSAPIAAIKAGGIGAHLRPQGAAHQSMYRLAKELSFQIPECDVDPAETLDDRTFLPVITIAGINLPPNPLTSHGILPNQKRRKAFHYRRIYPCRSVAFTPSDKTDIGFYLHDHCGAGSVAGAGIGKRLTELGFQDMAANFGDFHFTLSLCFKPKQAAPDGRSGSPTFWLRSY